MSLFEIFGIWDFSGADPQVRSWISYYIKNGQRKINESLTAFRTKLLDQLKRLINEAKTYQQRDGGLFTFICISITHMCALILLFKIFFFNIFSAISQHIVVRASAILRLYTALKGIAGLK